MAACPLGHTTTLTYDPSGNVQTTTDAEGKTTQFTYGALSRLTQVTDPDLKTTTYTYDSSGNLRTVIDAKFHTTTFDYDSVNRITKTTNPLGQSKSFTYDPAGNLISLLDPKGQTTTFTYDTAAQLTQKTLPGDTVTFGYDLLGNLTLAQDSDSRLEFAYDDVSRLTQAQTGDALNPAILQPETVITYTYDKNNNRLSMTDPQSGATNYVYDALNRLTTLTNPSLQTTTLTYDPLSRRTTLTHANGVATTYGYNVASQLLTLAHHLAPNLPLSQFTYTYDRVSNRLSKTQDATTSNYTYDDLNRLMTATNPTEAFTYDPVGNRDPATSIYNTANRLLNDGTFTYTYDPNGNLISKTEISTGNTTTYTYNPENQLTRIDFPDSTFSTYAYDALGRRIQKNVNGTLTRYVYDNEDILEEYDGSNTLRARYTHGPGIDEPLIMEEGGQSYYYHTDGLGSVTEITDSTGAVVKTFQYDAFGNVTSETGTLIQPYGYTGRERDTESGLLYYRARYMDPRIGRFLQEDPVAGIVQNPQTLNKYPYVTNNPTNFVDPKGANPLLIKVLLTLLGAYLTAKTGEGLLEKLRQIQNIRFAILELQLLVASSCDPELKERAQAEIARLQGQLRTIEMKAPFEFASPLLKGPETSDLIQDPAVREAIERLSGSGIVIF